MARLESAYNSSKFNLQLTVLEKADRFKLQAFYLQSHKRWMGQVKASRLIQLQQSLAIGN